MSNLPDMIQKLNEALRDAQIRNDTRNVRKLETQIHALEGTPDETHNPGLPVREILSNFEQYLPAAIARIGTASLERMKDLIENELATRTDTQEPPTGDVDQ